MYYLVESIDKNGYVARTRLYMGVGDISRFSETCQRRGIRFRILEVSDE